MNRVAHLQGQLGMSNSETENYKSEFKKRYLNCLHGVFSLFYKLINANRTITTLFNKMVELS